jgi:hypothetical protein
MRGEIRRPGARPCYSSGTFPDGQGGQQRLATTGAVLRRENIYAISSPVEGKARKMHSCQLGNEMVLPTRKGNVLRETHSDVSLDIC